MKKNKEQTVRVKVGITHGDINGIGYEVIYKALQDKRILELCTPVVYGLPKVAAYHRKTLTEVPNFNQIQKPSEAKSNSASIIAVSKDEFKVNLGKASPEAGKAAHLALEKSLEDIRSRDIDVIVTAPIDKNSIHGESFPYEGHTEFFCDKFEARDVLMFMISEKLRVAVVIGHIPLSKVSESITKEKILSKLHIMNRSLKSDFNIRKPRIAVLGLNPHAGDNGLLGSEEKDIITPAIEAAYEKGIMAYGPFGADGLFGSGAYKSYDGILAMYHDLGLAPFKALAFDGGVNFTAGLPVIRTSPAHGTGYDLVGKNEAHPESLRMAIYTAIDLYRNRKANSALNRNKLEPSKENTGRNHRQDTVAKDPSVKDIEELKGAEDLPIPGQKKEE